MVIFSYREKPGCSGNFWHLVAKICKISRAWIRWASVGIKYCSNNGLPWGWDYLGGIMTAGPT